MKTGNLEVRTGAMVPRSSGGARRDGARRFLRRQEDAQRSRRLRQDRGARRKLLRDGADHAELQSAASSRTASPTPPGWWAVTSWTRSARQSSGYLPILEDLPPQNEDGVGGMHMYMPWWLYKEQKAGKMPFARGYHIETRRRPRHPGAGALGGSHSILGGGYGVELKRESAQDLRRQRALRRPRRNDPEREQLLRNRPQRGRSVGHPRAALPLQMEPGRNPAGETHAGDVQGDHRDGRRQGDLQCRARPTGASRAAAKSFTKWAPPRWATIPKTSVLNQYCQAWDCKNLFITDAAPFVSNADKNPTLTITALGWRTSEYIADQVKKLNVKV